MSDDFRYFGTLEYGFEAAMNALVLHRSEPALTASFALIVLVGKSPRLFCIWHMVGILACPFIMKDPSIHSDNHLKRTTAILAVIIDRGRTTRESWIL